MKEEIRSKLLNSGAVAVGFASACEIDESLNENLKYWMANGYHGDMAYLERHLHLKQHPDSVLPGVKTVISLAFDYNPGKWREESLPYIASYAYGRDYHETLREKLKPIVKNLKKDFGGEWRICIDSAPVAERYWAIKSGIGRRGLNGAVIIDGSGSLSFLVEILTTLELVGDVPSDQFCFRCGKCISICPAKALHGDGTMDARKCINYLSIEKRGDFSHEEKEILQAGSGYLFGCDRCLRVCPHNIEIAKEEKPDTELENLIQKLTPEEILSLDKRTFKEKFKTSPLLYAGYDKLIRNALTLLKK